MMALLYDSAAVGTLFEAKRMKLLMTQTPRSRGTATARPAARESELQLPANEQAAACGRCCSVREVCVCERCHRARVQLGSLGLPACVQTVYYHKTVCNKKVMPHARHAS